MNQESGFPCKGEFKILKRIIAIVFFLAMGFAPTQATAINPHSNVIVPFLAAGEREFELNMGTRTHANALRASSATFGYGYAFTNFFKSEIKFGFNQIYDSPGIDHTSVRVDSVAWENHLLLTDRGEYFIDPGIFWEIEKGLNPGLGNDLMIGGIFRKDVGMLELNFNAYLEKAIDRKIPQPVQMGYQLQGKYRFFQTPRQSTLSFGAQGFGGLGEWNNWLPREDQIHRIGPAIFYRWRIGPGRNAWNGSVAYLFDLTNRHWVPGSDANSNNDFLRSRAQTFRVQIEYAF